MLTQEGQAVRNDYIIKWLCKAEVNEKKDEYNTNNHYEVSPWGTPESNPDFGALYRAACDKYNFTKWYKGEPPGVVTVPISHYLTTKLAEATSVRVLSDSTSVLKWEEIEEIIGLIDAAIPEQGANYFVRTDRCSAKDAGMKPVTSGKDAVSLITCSKRCLAGFSAAIKDRQGTVILLAPWNTTIDAFWEFRVFVYQGRITAISQYACYDDAGWRSREDNIGRVVSSICGLYRRLKDKDCVPWDDCVMDAHITKETYEAELIEFNPFGAHLSSGSALFHWIRDHGVLYGEHEAIEIRFVDKA